MGLPELVIIAVVYATVLAGVAARSRSVALVVTDYWVSDTPRETDGAYINILARNSGLVAWLMTVLSIQSVHRLSVFYDDVVLERRSIFGYTRVLLPVPSVSSVITGYHKPWLKALLYWGVFAALGAGVEQEYQSAIGGILVALLGTVIAIVVFILNRSLTVVVREQEGSLHGLSLKRSVIEGVEIDEQALSRITTVFGALLQNHASQRLVT
jgi:hypothetical protein